VVTVLAPVTSAVFHFTFTRRVLRLLVVAAQSVSSGPVTRAHSHPPALVYLNFLEKS
jgi:hypothetical protein